MRQSAWQRQPLYAALLLAISLPIVSLLLTGCTTSATKPDYAKSATRDFEIPARLEPNVDFWRKVYSEWSRAQVAIHDDRYMDVIYQVATLPGPIKPSYTGRQQDFVDHLKASWRGRLTQLAQKVASNATLTSEERALAAQLRKAGGTAALIDPAERVRSQRGLRERFHRGLELSGRYDKEFREIFRRHGVPEDLAYLPHVESSFQLHARSSAGAAGMWQFIRSTGRHYMTVNGAMDERLDPFIAADAAARYLAEAHRQLGSWPLAITSYNHGVGGMNNAKRMHGNDIGDIVQNYQGRYFGFASRNFYAEFLAARYVARNANAYFPGGISYEAPVAHKPLRLTRSQTLSAFAREHEIPVHELIRANPAWRNPIRDGFAPIPAGSIVWLPESPKSAPRKREPRVDAPLFGAS
jgi:membrane-bound lytic murein transglycosylase D